MGCWHLLVVNNWIILLVKLMSNNQQLIEDFRKSLADKNRAKLVIAGLVVTTIIAFTFISWNSFNSFLVSAVPEVSSLLAQQVSENSGLYAADLNRSAAKVLPVYSSQLQTTLKKEWPTIEKAGEAELLALNEYAQQHWPEIKNDLAKIAKDQESTIQQELEKVLGQGQGEKIATTYSEAALNEYKKFEKANFTEHGEVGRSIGANLYKVLEKEPDVPSDVDMHEAFGLALEVLGLELQELGKK